MALYIFKYLKTTSVSEIVSRIIFRELGLLVVFHIGTTKKKAKFLHKLLVVDLLYFEEKK